MESSDNVTDQKKKNTLLIEYTIRKGANDSTFNALLHFVFCK